VPCPAFAARPTPTLRTHTIPDSEHIPNTAGNPVPRPPPAAPVLRTSPICAPCPASLHSNSDPTPCPCPPVPRLPMLAAPARRAHRSPCAAQSQLTHCTNASHKLLENTTPGRYLYHAAQAPNGVLATSTPFIRSPLDACPQVSHSRNTRRLGLFQIPSAAPRAMLSLRWLGSQPLTHCSPRDPLLRFLPPPSSSARHNNTNSAMAAPARRTDLRHSWPVGLCSTTLSLSSPLHLAACFKHTTPLGTSCARLRWRSTASLNLVLA